MHTPELEHPEAGYGDWEDAGAKWLSADRQPAAAADRARRDADWLTVAQLDTGGYDWSAAAVWRNLRDGRLYYELDSGCSCYGPWESSSMDTLQPMQDWIVFRDAVLSHFEYEGSPQEVSAFLDKVRRLPAHIGTGQITEEPDDVENSVYERVEQVVMILNRRYAGREASQQLVNEVLADATAMLVQYDIPNGGVQAELIPATYNDDGEVETPERLHLQIRPSLERVNVDLVVEQQP